MTRQIRDILIYENEEYHINQELLERYFFDYPNLRPKSDMICTALWRGYMATFEIKEDQFFIQELSVFADMDLNLKTLDKLFPNNNKFEWFSGLIRIDNDRGEWDDEKPGDAFEFLEIYKGNFIQKRVMDFEELEIFKDYQFEYFKETEEYEKAYAFWRKNNEDKTRAQIDEYIYEGLLLRYSKEMFDNEMI